MRIHWGFRTFCALEPLKLSKTGLRLTGIGGRVHLGTSKSANDKLPATYQYEATSALLKSITFSQNGRNHAFNVSMESFEAREF